MNLSAPNPNDRISELRALREWLDDYGTTPESRRRSWDEVLDDYDNLLTDTATRVGIPVPDPPKRLARRLAPDDRDALETLLAGNGIDVRNH